MFQVVHINSIKTILKEFPERRSRQFSVENKYATWQSGIFEDMA